MAKKKVLLARVSYNPGTGNKKDFYGRESFVIETYDNEADEWVFKSSYDCRRCAENPEAESADFVSYKLMKELFHLKDLGYSVHDAGQIERGHEVNG